MSVNVMLPGAPSSPSSSSPSNGVYDISRIRNVTGGAISDRTSLLIVAKAAEKAERWEEVCRLIREIIKIAGAGGGGGEGELSSDERSLLWLGYKQYLGALRASWKTSAKFLASSTVLDAELVAKFPEIIEDYKAQIEREMIHHATELLQLLENILIKSATTNETKIFYMKLAGDYYRYVAEVSPIKGYERRAVDYYQSAYKLATSHLFVNHPTRLSVALNYSVCLYELFRHKKEAAEIAKHAFEGAIHRLDDLDEHQYKDSTLIMQLIRDNLTLWTQLEQQQQEHAK